MNECHGCNNCKWSKPEQLDVNEIVQLDSRKERAEASDRPGLSFMPILLAAAIGGLRRTTEEYELEYVYCFDRKKKKRGSDFCNKWEERDVR